MVDIEAIAVSPKEDHGRLKKKSLVVDRSGAIRTHANRQANRIWISAKRIGAAGVAPWLNSGPL
jgi:hypothetical protein